MKYNAPISLVRTIKTIVLFVVCVAGSGCTIVEKMDVEIRYTPQLLPTFDILSAPVQINNARLFLYTKDGLLMHDTLFTAQRMSQGQPPIIIRGFESGEYQMLSIYNSDQMVITGNDVDQSRIEDLEISLPAPSKAIDKSLQIDSICRSISKFVVERGTQTKMEVELLPAHYFVTVTVSGLDRLTVAAGSIGIELIDIPLSISGDGQVRRRQSVDIELDSISSDARFGELMTLMFLSQDNASLRVKENGVPIQTIHLEPERYFSADQPTNQLHIQVQFYANSYVVLVNEWKLGEYELINFG